MTGTIVLTAAEIDSLEAVIDFGHRPGFGLEEGPSYLMNSSKTEQVLLNFRIRSVAGLQ